MHHLYHSLSLDPPADILHQYPSASPGKPPQWHRAGICRLPAAPSPAESRDAAHARRPDEHIFYQPAIGFIIRQLHRAVCPDICPSATGTTCATPTEATVSSSPRNSTLTGSRIPPVCRHCGGFSPSAAGGGSSSLSQRTRCAPLPRRGKNHRHTA